MPQDSLISDSLLRQVIDKLGAHDLSGGLDSIARGLHRLEPVIVDAANKSILEKTLELLVTVLIPIFIFACGYYFEKLRNFNLKIDELQSYKRYCFNCIELLYGSCLSQAKFLREYTEQFDSYGLDKRLTIVSDSATKLSKELAFDKLYSACVEYSGEDKLPGKFKRFQDELFMGTNLLEDMLPVHKFFIDKYSEVQARAIEVLQALDSLASEYRGRTTEHTFFYDVCVVLFNLSKTQKGPGPFYLIPDQLNTLCNELRTLCGKHTAVAGLGAERVRVESCERRLQVQVESLTSLFDQYKEVFNARVDSLEQSASSIRSSAEELARASLYGRKLPFGARSRLDAIVLEFD